MTEAYFDDRLTYIGNAICGMTSLQTLHLPAALTSLTDETFIGLTSLMALNASGVTNYENGCLSPLLGLTELSINMVNAGADTNYGLSALTDLNEIYVINCKRIDAEFQNCKSNNIIFANSGAGITVIASGAFKNSDVIDLDFRNSTITAVESYVFQAKTNTFTVRLPNTVKVLKENCFKDSSVNLTMPTALTAVYSTDAKLVNADSIPNSVTIIGSSAFKNWRFSNPDITLTSTAKTLNTYSFNGSNIRSIRINTGTVPAYCFSDCTSLSGIWFTSTTNHTAIGDNAFSGCQSLVSVDFNNVRSVGNNAFSDSRALKRISSSTLTSFTGTSFIYATDLELNAITNLTCGMQECTRLTSFSGSQIKAIGDGAFESCGIAELDTPGLTSIGERSFYGTTSLTEFDFSKIQSIKESSFQYSNLEILDNMVYSFLQKLAALASTKFLYGCSRILELNMETVTNTQFNQLFGGKWGVNLIVDQSLLDKTNEYRRVYNAIKAGFGFTTNNAQIIFKDVTVTYNGGLAEYECLKYSDSAKTVLTGIDTTQKDFNTWRLNPTFPDSCRTIQTGSFDGIPNRISSMAFNYVRTILHSALTSQTDSLSTVTFNQIRVESIGHNAFNGCRRIKNINTENLVKLQLIGNNAFKDCENIKTFHFYDELTSIGQYAFGNCTSIISASMPPYLVQLNKGAFSGCKKLQDIKLTKGPSFTTLQQDILSGTSVMGLEIYDNVTTLSSSCLRGLNKDCRIKFNDRTRSDAKTITGFTSNIQNSTLGTRYYTQNNAFKYPSFITKRSNFVAEIKNDSFETYGTVSNNTCNIKLLSVDDHVGQDVPLYIKDYHFDNIDSISPNAFLSSRVIDVEIPLGLSSQFPQHVFSTCLSLDVISLSAYYTPDLSGLLKYWTDEKYNAVISFLNGELRKPSHFVSCDDVFEYEIINGVITIVGVIDSRVPSTGKINIQSKYKQISSYAMNTTRITQLSTNQVSAIYNYALSGNNSITSLTLDSEISRLGPLALARSNIREVTFNNCKIGNIPACGLSDDSALAKITVNGSNIRSISPGAFSYPAGGILTVDFNASNLTSIGNNAFRYGNLNEPTVSRISFNQLGNLKVVNDGAFYNTIKNTTTGKLVFSNSTLSVNDYAFAYNRYVSAQQISALGLNKVQHVGSHCFEYNAFQTVDMGDNVRELCSYSFAYPRYKQQIYLPNSLQSIGLSAFFKNIIYNPFSMYKNVVSVDNTLDAIKSIVHVTADAQYMADNKAGFTDGTLLSALRTNYYKGFSYIYGNKMHFCPGNAYIDIYKRAYVSCDTDSLTAYVPKYLSDISASAFKGCDKLQMISATEVLNIGPSAFYGCSSLEYFNNRSSEFHVADVLPYQFYNCAKLQNVKLLSTVTSIGEYAFYGCAAIDNMYSSLDDIEFFTLSSISDHAFDGCSSLRSFNICKRIKNLGDGTFDNCNNLDEIRFYFTSKQFLSAIGMAGASISAAVVDKFGGVRSDGQCCIKFTDCAYMNSGIQKVDNEYVKAYRYDTDKWGISGINYDAYNQYEYNVLNLSGFSRIDGFVFNGIDKLQSVSFIPNSVTGAKLENIGRYAFYSCNSLAIVNNYALDCTNIGEYCFGNCSNLRTLELDANALQNVGQGAFYNTSLENISFKCEFTEEHDLGYWENAIYNKIGWTESNMNPLELPEKCQIYIKDAGGNISGVYDYLFNNLLYEDVDINRQQVIYVDRSKSSVKPVLLVQPISGKLPAIVTNTFHANIIGRWK